MHFLNGCRGAGVLVLESLLHFVSHVLVDCQAEVGLPSIPTCTSCLDCNCCRCAGVVVLVYLLQLCICSPLTSGDWQHSLANALLSTCCTVYLCRCAGVVVLVSLLQLCTNSPLLREQLPRLQATFTGLLGDSNDLTQVRCIAMRGIMNSSSHVMSSCQNLQSHWQFVPILNHGVSIDLATQTPHAST